MTRAKQHARRARDPVDGFRWAGQAERLVLLGLGVALLWAGAVGALALMRAVLPRVSGGATVRMPDGVALATSVSVTTSVLVGVWAWWVHEARTRRRVLDLAGFRRRERSAARVRDTQREALALQEDLRRAGLRLRRLRRENGELRVHGDLLRGQAEEMRRWWSSLEQDHQRLLGRYDQLTEEMTRAREWLDGQTAEALRWDGHYRVTRSRIRRSLDGELELREEIVGQEEADQ